MAYSYSMMEFFRNMKDTAAYLKAAVDYYERFHMKISADSVKRWIL